MIGYGRYILSPTVVKHPSTLKKPRTRTRTKEGEQGTELADEYDEYLGYVQAEQQVRQWEDCNDRAHGIICSAASSIIRHEVINKEISKEVWEELKRRYNVVSDI